MGRVREARPPCGVRARARSRSDPPRCHQYAASGEVGSAKRGQPRLLSARCRHANARRVSPAGQPPHHPPFSTTAYGWRGCQRQPHGCGQHLRRRCRQRRGNVREARPPCGVRARARSCSDLWRWVHVQGSREAGPAARFAGGTSARPPAIFDVCASKSSRLPPAAACADARVRGGRVPGGGYRTRVREPGLARHHGAGKVRCENDGGSGARRKLPGAPPGPKPPLKDKARRGPLEGPPGSPDRFHGLVSCDAVDDGPVAGRSMGRNRHEPSHIVRSDTFSCWAMCGTERLVSLLRSLSSFRAFQLQSPLFFPGAAQVSEFSASQTLATHRHGGKKKVDP